MKEKITFVFSLFMATMVSAQVNFSEHVAPIIYDNCTVCHRAGEIGPMPLTNYDEVKAWGSMIEYVTSIKYMPPWPADRDFSTFLGETALTEDQIQTIADWVADGMEQGDPALEPAPPTFPDGSQIGDPDLVLSFAESYVHEGDLTDQYQIIVLPTGLTEDKMIKSIEMRPGNTGIVHHALFAVDDTGQGQVMDAQTPEYGFPSFGDFGVPGVTEFPQGYVPGAAPRKFHTGIGAPMPAGSDLLLQMHYAPIPTTESDSSTVNIFFADANEVIEREVKQEIMLPFFGTLTNGPFFIQAETIKTFHGVITIPEKITLMGIFPHAHLLGTDWEVVAISPSGDTTNLIRIPEYDFNWQRTYFFKQFQVLEAGTEVHAYATYDNTSDNPFNPNNPPIGVGWGLGTQDEMYYLPLVYVEYFPGDEDIVLSDDPVSSAEELGLKFPSDKLYPVYPNPSDSEITIGFTLAQTEKVNLEIVNLNGQVMKTILSNDLRVAGPHQMRVQIGDLPSGMYLLNVRNDRISLAEKFFVGE